MKLSRFIPGLGLLLVLRADQFCCSPLAVQKQLLNRSESISLGRSKSVYQQRNLGTIRARKIEKKQSTSSTSGEMILRVLRLQ